MHKNKVEDFQRDVNMDDSAAESTCIFEPWCRLKLAGSITCSKCVSWSSNNKLAITDSNAVLVCNIINEWQVRNSDNHGFVVKVESLEANKTGFKAPGAEQVAKLLAEFEDLGTQSSNTATPPNFLIYKLQFDANVNRGLNATCPLAIGFPSRSNCDTSLLGVLSTQTNLLVYQEKTDGVSSAWEKMQNLNDSLAAYWESRKGRGLNGDCNGIDHFTDEKDFKEFYSNVITCFSWSSFYLFHKTLSKSLGFLCAVTKDSTIVIWKCVSQEGEKSFSIVHTYQCEAHNVNFVTWFEPTSNKQGKLPESLCILVSNVEGEVTAIKIALDYSSEGGDFVTKLNYVTSIRCKSIWDEKDYLGVTNVASYNTENSVMLFLSKSHVVLCLQLDEDLNVIRETSVDHLYTLPINGLVCTSSSNTGGGILFSCSSDGHIVRSRFIVQSTGSVLFQGHHYVMRPEDIGGYSLTSPTVLNGISVSPNGYFMAVLLTSLKVKRSVQTERLAVVNIYQLKKSPQSQSNILSLEDWSDCLETCYYEMSHNPDYRQKIVESVLNRSENVWNLPTKELSLKWNYLKMLSNVKIAISDSLKEVNNIDLEISRLERCIIAKQMFRLLNTWCNLQQSSASSENGTVILPVKEILQWLNTCSKVKTFSDDEGTLITNINTKYATSLPDLCCMFTGSKLSLSADAKVYCSADGSEWPVCHLSFLPLQTNSKRRCLRSKSYSLVPSRTMHPSWLLNILSQHCIFSGTAYLAGS